MVLMQLHPLTRYLAYQLYHARIMLGTLSREGGEEEVHAFRVALRRVRSLVKLYLKHILPFPAELKSAVRGTNTLRELDVLIGSLTPAEYPQTVKALKRMRREHLETLLRSDFAETTRKVLLEYCNDLCNANPPLPAEKLLRRIEGHFTASLEVYRSISVQTRQKELHRLRIDFKNARYGFEFLRDEGIGEEDAKIAECKKIQNALGAVQDGYNQIEWLKKLYKHQPCEETKRLLKERKQGLKKLKAASRLG